MKKEKNVTDFRVTSEHFYYINEASGFKHVHEHALLKSIESKLLAYLTAEKNAFLSKVFLVLAIVIKLFQSTIFKEIDLK